MGSTRQQTDLMVKDIQKINMGLTEMSKEELADQYSAVVDQIGLVNDETKTLVKQSAVLGKSFSLSADESANILRIQSSILGLTEDQITVNAVYAKQLSKNYGITGKAIYKELAANSEAE